MASSSGASSGSGSSQIQNSGSEGHLQALMDQRKRKRMISNRESARRSRMRKQKHMSDLMEQVAQLREENNRIITTINITSQHFLNIEAENSVLRAQAGELTHRLQSLNEIITVLNAGQAAFNCEDTSSSFIEPVDGFLNPLNMAYLNQPIMASPELFQY